MERSLVGCSWDQWKRVHSPHVEHAGSEKQFPSIAVSVRHGLAGFGAFETRHEVGFLSCTDKIHPGFVSGSYHKAASDYISV